MNNVKYKVNLGPNLVEVEKQKSTRWRRTRYFLLYFCKSIDPTGLRRRQATRKCSKKWSKVCAATATQKIVYPKEPCAIWPAMPFYICYRRGIFNFYAILSQKLFSFETWSRFYLVPRWKKHDFKEYFTINCAASLTIVGFGMLRRAVSMGGGRGSSGA